MSFPVLKLQSKKISFNLRPHIEPHVRILRYCCKFSAGYSDRLDMYYTRLTTPDGFSLMNFLFIYKLFIRTCDLNIIISLDGLPLLLQLVGCCPHLSTSPLAYWRL